MTGRVSLRRARSSPLPLIAQADQLLSRLGERNITGFIGTLTELYPAPWRGPPPAPYWTGAPSHRRFREEGIEIPFPQHVIHMAKTPPEKPGPS